MSSPIFDSTFGTGRFKHEEPMTTDQSQATPQDVRHALELQLFDLIELARDTRSDKGGEAKWVHPRGALVKEFAKRIAALAQSDAEPGWDCATQGCKQADMIDGLVGCAAKYRAKIKELEAALAQSDAGHDWQLVPKQPTEEMVEAHFGAHARAETVFAEVSEIWEAMLKAAPAPPRPDASGLIEALEQALDCIRGETPEDMSHEEARQDTINKIRAVLNPRAADRSA